MAEHYKYSPLPAGEHIRVLILHPSSSYQDPVQCDLEPVQLDAPGDYAALSYSWAKDKTGDASLSHSIGVSAKPTKVTQNLFEGLKRLRHPVKKLRLWVDAVCIDQSNAQEKTEQVSRMSKVYSNASQTVIWLGEGESENDDLAIFKFFQFLTHDLTFVEKQEHVEERELLLEQYPHFAWLGTEGIENCTWSRSDGDSVDLIAVARWAWSEISDEERVTQFWTNNKLRSDVFEIGRILHALFDRRYFTRRWVFQEIYHSNLASIEAFWGPCRLPLGLFLRIPMIAILGESERVLESCQGRLNAETEAMKSLHVFKDTHRLGHSFNNILRTRQEGEDFDDHFPFIALALYLGSGLQCSDPRDKLFALISMDGQFGLLPNYQLTTTQVYTLFAQMLVEKGMLYIILDTLSIRFAKLHSWKTSPFDPLEKLENLPSWVPDLRHNFRATMAKSESMEANVSHENVLTCMVKLIGTLGPGSDTEELKLTIIQNGTRYGSFQDEEFAGPQLLAGDSIVQTCGPKFYLVLRTCEQADEYSRLVHVVTARGGAWPDPGWKLFEVRIAQVWL
jgi:hypothetical protein